MIWWFRYYDENIFVPCIYVEKITLLNLNKSHNSEIGQWTMKSIKMESNSSLDWLGNGARWHIEIRKLTILICCNKVSVTVGVWRGWERQWKKKYLEVFEYFCRVYPMPNGSGNEFWLFYVYEWEWLEFEGNNKF